MRVLITGGAGFIGSALVRACLAAGEEVRVLDDFSSGRSENLADLGEKIELIRGSVVDGATLEQAISGCAVIFHLAARPSVAESIEDPIRTHAINLGGTLQTLDAALHEPTVRRLVFASSCAVYGDTETLPLSEDLPAAPGSPYALHKLAGELYLGLYHRLYGLETVALRFFNVFGPRQNPESRYAAVVPIFADCVARGSTPSVHGDGLQSRDFVFVEDVASALRTAACAPPTVCGTVFNIGSGIRVSVLDLLREICRLGGRPDLAPEFAPLRPGEIRHSQADVSRAARELGWKPAYSLSEGLRATLEVRTQSRGAA